MPFTTTNHKWNRYTFWLVMQEHWKLRWGEFYYLVYQVLFFFFYGCVGSSFLCEGFLQLWQAGATLHRGARASHCRGLSCYAEHMLQTRRLSNCGSRAQLLRGMWDLPRPGPEPLFPALAGRFSTTVPPGKPLYQVLNIVLLCSISLSFTSEDW